MLAFLLVSGQLHAQETKNLVILHHNDTHSRIEPMPGSHATYPGLGGVVRQDACVGEVRKENPNVLLFHCGDFFQGTPYFNEFGGKVEIECMNLMRYDVVCLGNHEFDNGLDSLAARIREAHFPVVSTNLDFSGTVLDGLTEKYVILERNGLKIGVI
jgi:5'-nucleotidase